ncbi:MAG: YchJ family metal-binding protein [Campylobacterota bacterium]|nr:YchJ family metal-binding protein [Campylobacterota bacterium]
MKTNMSISTPKELMKSRYEAFIREDWDYIANTSLNQTLEELTNSLPVKWLKLDVIDAYDNIVEFKAYYQEDKKINVLHEKSRFTKVDGIWKYLDGELYNTKIERNESCTCGSGKKFKKCCG